MLEWLAARRLQAPLIKRKEDLLSWESCEAGFVGQLPLAEWKWHAACRTFSPVRTSFSSWTLGSLRCFWPFDSKRPASALHISAHPARWTGPPHLCRILPVISANIDRSRSRLLRRSSCVPSTSLSLCDFELCRCLSFLLLQSRPAFFYRSGVYVFDLGFLRDSHFLYVRIVLGRGLFFVEISLFICSNLVRPLFL